MERIKPRTLSGFMELLPARQTQFERMLETLRTTYALYGFTPLDTPVIESAEILLAKGGDETEEIRTARDTAHVAITRHPEMPFGVRRFKVPT